MYGIHISYSYICTLEYNSTRDNNNAQDNKTTGTFLWVYLWADFLLKFKYSCEPTRLKSPTRYDIIRTIIIVKSFPTIRRIGLPYDSSEGLLNAGFRTYIFYFWAWDPLGRGGLIWLASLAWLRSASRLSISWFFQPTYRLKSVSWLVG